MSESSNETRLSPDRFDAVILDLDGVITRTADVHAAAWKSMFDEFLEERTPAGQSYEPFDPVDDYRAYVDGRPRYEGVGSFLESRGIDLPYGDPEDPPGRQTVCGLGNRKNELFLERLRIDGVEAFPSSVALIRALRRSGMRTAVVSSSRNCRAVLAAAGIEDLFDQRVDGRDLLRSGLAGKPAPDMFQEASHRLGSEPARTVGVEDALAGVQAAKAAGLGLVIGVDRDDQAEALREHGADRVVADLGELTVADGSNAGEPARALPSALEQLDRLLPDRGRDPALFLDYDGTLTPIVSRPDAAVLDDRMRATLRRLAGLCTLAVISGRDLADVRERVAIEGIWYAGSHGFDIAGPEGGRREYQQGSDYLPDLDAAEQALKEALGDVPGCLVERKRFSIAVHFRRVADDRLSDVRQTVEQVHARYSRLRLAGGKKIFELQPDIDWDKGKALRWLMQQLDLSPRRSVPIYIGDDVTDEDAFRELESDGVGILVAPGDRPTRAAYRLDDPEAVRRFLQRLGDRLVSARP